MPDLETDLDAEVVDHWFELEDNDKVYLYVAFDDGTVQKWLSPDTEWEVRVKEEE